ncbi:MAG: hypothetical protein OEZ01_14840, partial [Candidatus Heimdallarchaeota archaeon]|nr:hypothetical protein [Candidatus Heimdallarchaeota archaeon]
MSLIPVQVMGLPPVVAVAAGQTHALALGLDASVWGWGLGAAGQLGAGWTEATSGAIPILEGDEVVAIAANGLHSLALLEDGTLLAWGDNTSGQLGPPAGGTRSQPLPVAGLPASVATAAGGAHSLALTDDGRVFAWGDNTYGQLGDGTTLPRENVVEVTALLGAAQLAAGARHSQAVLTDGMLLGWGSNDNGRVGDGTTELRPLPVPVLNLGVVTAVGPGSHHNLAVEAFQVWSWGDNASGQLGDGTLNEQHAPALVAGVTDMVAVAGGEAHSLAMTSTGEVYAWGDNGAGQLGDGTTTDRPTPDTVTTGPHIAVSQPSGPVTDGEERLTTLTPTIVIDYAPMLGALDMTSLLITVNGVDWTGRFSVGENQASYSVGEAERWSGGSTCVFVSLADVWGNVSTRERCYVIVPVLYDLTPTKGPEGTELTLSVWGLDPDVTANEGVFTGLFEPEVSAPFATVDMVQYQGTILIPDQAATGPVRVRVNGRKSISARALTVEATWPQCNAYLDEVRALADGGFVVLYGEYDKVQSDKRCPAIDQEFIYYLAARIWPDGSMTVLWTSHPTINGGIHLEAVTVDKTGLKPAVVGVTYPCCDGPERFVQIQYGGKFSELYLPNWSWFEAADFDGAGNLYLVYVRAHPRTVEIVRITAASLAQGGAVVSEMVISGGLESEPPECTRWARAFAVDCNGRAYLAVEPQNRSAACDDDNILWTARIHTLDLHGGVVLDTQIVPDSDVEDLNVTCESQEVLGMTYRRSQVEQIWRQTPDGTEILRAFPGPWTDVPWLAELGPDGRLYLGWADGMHLARLPKEDYFKPGCPQG